MKVTLSSQPLRNINADLLAIFVDADSWREALADLNTAFDGELEKLAVAEGFEGKAGQSFVLHTLGHVQSSQIALLGLGDSKLSNDEVKDAGGRAAKLAASVKAKVLAVHADWNTFGEDQSATLGLFGEGVRIGSYKFDRYLSEPTEHTIEQTLLLGTQGDEGHGLTFAAAAAAGITLARDLVNEPPDVCTPVYMAETAQMLASEYGFDVRILDQDGIEAEKMSLFAAVSRGSAVEPRFIHMTYTGAGTIERRLAYVGKGVTFDTGGYNLKPTSGILNMHCDMAGAAAVLGSAKTIGELKPAGVEVHFIVPTAANMISSGSYTVNEIIRGRGGKTVEINNTDAEGRLLLADALSYGADLDVDEIIDLATLTGACVVALGEHTTALFSNDDEVADTLLASARAAGERFWHMPLDDKLADKLKSSVADMKNTGDRWGGAITAALFLKKWVGDKKWAHLDIAGPAFLDKDTPLGPKGGTGVAVSALAMHALRAGKGQ